MKRLLIAMIILFCLTMKCNAQDSTPSMHLENPQLSLPGNALKSLKSAIMLMDNGMTESALVDLNNLAEQYPDDYTVGYERIYALYLLDEFKDVIRDGKRWLENKYANHQIYQLYGNALMHMGKHKQAADIYQKGIKRFPEAGGLYYMLGNTQLAIKKYYEAIVTFNNGIDADPDYSLNYFNSGGIYLSVEFTRVWGLIYAETAILLSPHNDDRHNKLASSMRYCFQSAITVEHIGDDTAIKISFAKENAISSNDDTQTVYMSFPTVYEGCMLPILFPMLTSGKPYTASLDQLIQIRTGLLETYFNATGNLYGNAMYLFPYQKSIIDAGHWEAYNYYLFSFACMDEFETWRKENSEKYDAFIDWFLEHPFKLDKDHTVGKNSIFNDYRKIDMTEALEIQAKFYKAAVQQ